MTLNKQLKELEKKELIILIEELSKFRKENKEFLELKLKGEKNIEELLLYYKKKIEIAFTFETFNLKNARTAINDFKKISKNEEYLFELLFYYVEKGTEFEYENGDLWEAFYTSIEKTFENCISLLNKHPHLISNYENRINNIIRKSCQGYGHQDIMEEILEELKK